MMISLRKNLLFMYFMDYNDFHLLENSLKMVRGSTGTFRDSYIHFDFVGIDISQYYVYEYDNKG